MKKCSTLLVPLTAVLLMCAGCGNQVSAEQEAVKEIISRNFGEVKGVYFSSFELVDSTTVAQELDRREALFSSKLDIERRHISDYDEKNMQKNAARHRESLAKTEEIIASLAALRESLAGCADSVIYRTYKFSCQGTYVEGGKFSCQDMFVNITPDGKACNLKSDDSYHSGMGETIPGYKELLESLRMTEE